MNATISIMPVESIIPDPINDVSTSSSSSSRRKLSTM